MSKRRYVQIFISIIFVLVCYVIFSDTYYGRLIRWNIPDVYDYQKFPFTGINNSDTVYKYPEKLKPELLSNIEFGNDKASMKSLDGIIEETKSNAFIIIQNDTIIYEQYFNGRNRESFCKAFSATKSVLSLLTGIAIQEGYINNINDPLKKYISGFKNEKLGEITIEQCLDQTSGIKYNKSMSMFSDKPKFYYTLNVRELIRGVALENKPGEKWNTDEYSVLLLGAALESAIGRPISDYLQEKIWKAAGMEYPATFSIDSKKYKFEHVADGLNAAAIDFAKIGSIALHNGYWNNKQIIPASWMEASVSTEGSAVTDWHDLNFKYLWWTNRTNGDYQAIGHFGQYIFVSPRSNTVIVRFGEEKGSISWWDTIFPRIVSEINKNQP